MKWCQCAHKKSQRQRQNWRVSESHPGRFGLIHSCWFRPVRRTYFCVMGTCGLSGVTWLVTSVSRQNEHATWDGRHIIMIIINMTWPRDSVRPAYALSVKTKISRYYCVQDCKQVSKWQAVVYIWSVEPCFCHVIAFVINMFSCALQIGQFLRAPVGRVQ